MKDVMVDLETLSTRDDAAIISIGAVEFDMETGEVGETLYVNVDWKANQALRRHIDLDTVQWWMKQSDAARMALFEGPSVSLFAALAKLENFFHSCKAKHIWSHSSFDERILRNAFGHINSKPPWHFRDIRDIRTLMALLPKGQPTAVYREGTHHNALGDALFQVKYCHEAWKIIHGTV